MATTTITSANQLHYRSKSRAMQVAFAMIYNSGISSESTIRQYGHTQRKVNVWIASAAPVVTAGDYLSAPVKRGDLVIETAAKTVYMVSTEVASATDAVFNQII